MAQMTPPINARGRFTLLAPFAANSSVIYTCAAIRSFEDLYDAGLEVYEVFYAAAGVTTGTMIAGHPFSFEDERRLHPNIITLIGNDNSVMHVPDTFIVGFPNLSEVNYSRVVLAISLPPIPDSNDLSALRTGVAAYVAQSYGVVATVEEIRAPSTTNPTTAQSASLESARVAAITLLETDRAKVVRLEAENALLRQQRTTLTAILTAHGWLPT